MEINKYRYIDEIINSYNKIVAWGAGHYFESYYNLFAGRISYIVDNDSSKEGHKRYGLTIYSPEKLKEETPSSCLIIVFCGAYEEVVKDIVKYGAFDAADASVYQLIHKIKIEASEEGMINTPGEHMILTCASVEMLWKANGVNKFIQNQNHILYQKGFHVLEIAPVLFHTNDRKKSGLLAVCLDQCFLGVFSLAELLEMNKIFHGVIIHSLYHEPWILEQLLGEIFVETKILYYLHDFYVICKRRFLYNKNELCLKENKNLKCRYCENCEEQIKNVEYHKHLFEKFSVILIAPSKSTRDIVKCFLDNIEIDVLPHLNYKLKKYNRHISEIQNIAYIGYPSDIKGWEEFCELEKNLRSEYNFFCLGKCQEDLKVEGITYVDIGKDRDQNEISMVEGLKKYKIDIAYVGSIWPETYSYTYHEAFEAGCFVIAFEAGGNVKDQIDVNKNGKWFTSVQKMSEWLSDKQTVQKVMDGTCNYIGEIKPDDAFLKYFEN